MKNVKIYIRALTFIVKSSWELLNEVNTRSNVTDNYHNPARGFHFQMSLTQLTPTQKRSGRENRKKIGRLEMGKIIK